ncbi:DUF4231 domain-containing protein [Nocardia vinacea]|uniref:DUF4231 domain-containing protein n=1 Tax=Nocardia vinacea TaxID=96468 RepID=UPI002E1171F3|nr:DUF4231 domain-containing protein [Nocardia vinacea]
MWQRLTDQIAWYSTRSRSAQRAYKLVKLAQVVIGATVPVIAALQAPAAVTASVAAVVVAAEGVQQLFQWHENWLNYRSTAEALKHERLMYLAESGPYTRPNRRKILVQRIESIAAQENTEWKSVHAESDKDTDNS